MVAVALVLGAGGIAGGAWHAAALGALAECGWDARDADLIVGTSAGAGIAAALRSGLPPADMLAGPLGEPMSGTGQGYADRAGRAIPMPEPEPRDGLPRPQAPGMTIRELGSGVARRGFRPVVAAAGLMPEGRASTTFMGDRVRRTHEEPWPDEPTWIVALRIPDGERVVFGRDAHTDLGTAVEASSAIPGYFAPVRHAGAAHVDGGIHSPTNADLVVGAGPEELGGRFDLVVISSPMSATRDALRRPKWMGSRPLHSATLRREVEAIRAQGTEVLVLQPDAEVVDAVGSNPRDTSRRPELVRRSVESIRPHLRSDAVADRLALLRS